MDSFKTVLAPGAPWPEPPAPEPKPDSKPIRAAKAAHERVAAILSKQKDTTLEELVMATGLSPGGLRKVISVMTWDKEIDAQKVRLPGRPYLWAVVSRKGEIK